LNVKVLGWGFIDSFLRISYILIDCFLEIKHVAYAELRNCLCNG